MTLLSNYIEKPWDSNHSLYKESFLNMKPAPEVTAGEILLASLYRNVGFSDHSEVSEKVWKLGTPFKKQLEKEKRPSNTKSPVGFEAQLWGKIVNRAIVTPKLSGESRKRGNQVTPLVPDATLYYMSARLQGNPWNPGKLIAKMIALGTGDYATALSIWHKLYEKLSVTEEDDVWARMIQTEFESWRVDSIRDAWQKPSVFPYAESTFVEKFNLDLPAKRFVEDLEFVLNLKQGLTRRQWISMLESLCRIGSSAHVNWLCHANDISREIIEQALQKGVVLTEAEVEEKISKGQDFWSVGLSATKPIKEASRRYIEGRGALNLILYMLADANFDMSRVSLASPTNISETLAYLASERERFDFAKYLSSFSLMMESDNKIADCKTGISKNVLAFLGSIACQRITSEAGLESYDQGYYFEKKGNYSTAPWVVGLGPLSILLMVHCAASRAIGPCTVQHLCEQLAKYGINAELALGSGEVLNKKLRDMSIAVDSPDAEGGMVIVSPLTELGLKGN
ncbi:hypothetical protein AYY26_06690 [Photobacterium phosphoreum]|uniref:hypothetical protein n=1 Tax=Photobacterium phosphoreum TaxID=659 RepID=UPI0007F94BFB|nr:hypothetical protein [Photobacterium phosphoreum]OBU41300.1 hypothetical protein AYY26_06690 [Photobacterium phosphoreum]